MARTPTTNHGFSKADSSTDLFSYAEDHVNLLTRLDAALAGLASYDAGGNRVNGNAANAGKILGGHQVIGLNAGGDATLVFQDNDGGTGVDKFALGYDDSADRFYLSQSGSFGADGLYVDTAGDAGSVGAFNVGGALEHQSARLQAFTLYLKNNSGVLQHAIGAGSGGITGNFVEKISGAVASWNNTPFLGTSTDFVAGFGIDASNQYIGIFNTADQGNGVGDLRGVAVVSEAWVGTDLQCRLDVQSINVNGVTRDWLTFRVFDDLGTPWNMNTTNITTGEYLRIQFLVFVK